VTVSRVSDCSLKTRKGTRVADTVIHVGQGRVMDSMKNAGKVRGIGSGKLH